MIYPIGTKLAIPKIMEFTTEELNQIPQGMGIMKHYMKNVAKFGFTWTFEMWGDGWMVAAKDRHGFGAFGHVGDFSRWGRDLEQVVKTVHDLVLKAGGKTLLERETQCLAEGQP